MAMQNQTNVSGVNDLQPQQTTLQQDSSTLQQGSVPTVNSDDTTSLLNSPLTTGQLQVSSSKEHTVEPVAQHTAQSWHSSLWLIILIIPVIIVVVLFWPQKDKAKERQLSEANLDEPTPPAQKPRKKQSRKQRRRKG